MIVEDILRLVNDHSKVLIDTKNGDGTYSILEECFAANVGRWRLYATVIEISVMNNVLVMTI